MLNEANWSPWIDRCVEQIWCFWILYRKTVSLWLMIPGNDKVCESSYQGPKIASYQTLTNYNTAPRGWDQTQSFYRPVTFGKQQEPIAYSDF